ncbi:DUF1206 domain-containing protein [Vannielia litorea]|uniref:DUF1206 domain-containing protein n=1 Tax=Vannielia litorea TaxID=1217970 RepID=A0A1N6FR56_9RHOB|nr:DUF1206 domain-containing protein [Vannielia litorea]SIN97779.1 protein of unknown function [Vannielia litorea]
MSEKAPAWVVPVMRAGYLARAAVYTVVGGLALTAAYTGGEAEGTTDALADLLAHWWGTPVLWLIAAGLWAYTVWRLIDAAMDLEDYGTDAKGLVARTGLVATGLIHGAIGVSVAMLALRGESGGGADGVTARVMAMPMGAWLVGAVGLATIGAGGYYGYKGVSERYKEHIRVTPAARRLDPVLKFGCIAEGVVIGVIGALICYAALTSDPGAAGGVGEALGQIRAAPFGRFLLGAVAVGLLAFAVENAVEGIYRVIPRRDGADAMTLARRARLEAEALL